MSAKNTFKHPAIAAFGIAILIGLFAGFVFRVFNPKLDETPVNSVTTVWTNELVQIATGATNGTTNNPKGVAGILLTNFTGTAMFVDASDGSVKYLGNDSALADAYKSGIDSGYVLGRIMASRETVRMYVRAYSDPSLADAAAMMAVRDANAATAFRLEEENALSEARKIIQESTNTTNHAP